jgi:hypothetical protein
MFSSHARLSFSSSITSNQNLPAALVVAGVWNQHGSNTEPSAVAPDAGINLTQHTVAVHWFRSSSKTNIGKLDSSIRRIHHPCGAAPPGPRSALGSVFV